MINPEKNALDTFLNQLGRTTNDSRITFKGLVNNETRHGFYLKVGVGLSYTLWFIGKDLISNKFIVENTGQ